MAWVAAGWVAFATVVAVVIGFSRRQTARRVALPLSGNPVFRLFKVLASAAGLYGAF